MKYKILSGSEPNELVEYVNKHLAAGWQLQGGIAFQVIVVDDDYTRTFYQAMVKPSS
jgi:hypothetical protein